MGFANTISWQFITNVFFDIDELLHMIHQFSNQALCLGVDFHACFCFFLKAFYSCSSHCTNSYIIANSYKKNYIFPWDHFGLVLQKGLPWSDDVKAQRNCVYWPFCFCNLTILSATGYSMLYVMQKLILSIGFWLDCASGYFIPC